MVEQKYWFARRFPVGHPRNAMAPVSTEGWLLVASFAADLAVGALLWLYLASIGQAVFGIIAFIALAIMGAGMLIVFAGSRGDQQHTVEDYKAGRVS